MFQYFEWLLVAFPLLGTLVNGLLGRRFSQRAQSAVAWGAVGCSLLVALPLLAGQTMAPGLVGKPPSIPWVRVWSEDRFVEGALALRVDALSTFTAFVVLCVGLSTHLYLVHRLAQADSHLTVAALNGAIGSLVLLILADNMPTLFLGWALTGWCSLWLSQNRVFPYPDTPADRKEAISDDVEKRGGQTPRLSMAMFHLASDICLLLAIGMMSESFASLTLEDITTLKPLSVAEGLGSARLSSIVVCLVVSVAIRSAQFPFHAWLTERASDTAQGTFDPAAGATIYALTSIPAGVYLLARLHPLVGEVTFGSSLLSWWGAGSALLMALAAWVQPDMRRLVRYAAISQGGFLLAALGLGAYTAALSYLFAYLLLQALIFLAAGDISWAKSGRAQGPGKMHKHLDSDQAAGPAIALGLVAATSVPTLPGFAFNRDLLSAAFHANKGIWLLTMTSTLLVAASAARSVMTYAKQTRAAGPNSLPLPARTALSALAFAAIVLGLLGLASPSPIERFVKPALGGGDLGQSSGGQPSWWWLVIPPALTVAGAALAYWAGAQAKQPLAGVRRWIAGGYSAPVLYQTVVGRPLLDTARFVAHKIEPSAARWTVDWVAEILDRPGHAAPNAPAGREGYQGPGPTLLPYILGVSLILAFLLITLFLRKR